jgi:polysaccharide biosynthesis/export protein
MNKRWIPFILSFFLSCPLVAEDRGSTKQSDLTAEEILLKQAQPKSNQASLPQKLNEQMQALAGMPRTETDYHLGAGDVIELTVAGIPGLDNKVFSLDSQGRISVPYLGEVELLGLTARDSETKLIRLFSVSLLEDPQVSISMKEYKSQNFYVLGAVRKPAKYSISGSTDILDALSMAGGLTEKADSKIKLYRYPQQSVPENIAAGVATNAEAQDGSIPSNSMEIDLSELLENARNNNRMAILAGDVIEVQERRERNYYVLGDVLRPGPFPMHQDESMVLSQALGSAGGMLKTASGSKVVILRHSDGGALPKQIRVDAYKVLKGTTQDIELLHNDIVLVPGSASKTLGKAFLGGVGGVLSALLVIGFD